MKEISISTASKNYSVIVGSGILTVDNVKEFYGREILLVIDPNIEMSVKEKSIGILHGVFQLIFLLQTFQY